MWFLTDTVRRFPARRMLLGCLVAVFVVTVGAPGVGVAKVDLDSWLGGMEGDPGDGLESTGGGSAYVGDSIPPESGPVPPAELAPRYDNQPVFLDRFWFILFSDGKVPVFLIFNVDNNWGNR